jgi:tetratricopeptide (TPR) repeat protein
VWLDDVRRGATGEQGKLLLRNIPAGAHRIRVRANGFRESTVAVAAAKSGEIKITLVKTNDEAELTFQRAESETDKEKSADLYEKALALRPKFAEAQLGYARVLADLGDSEGAMKAIADARKSRTAWSDASAVEGRIYKNDGDEEKAIASFKRAILEGRGFQPEANAGLGLLYKERAEGFSNDPEQESAAYNLAIKYLRNSIRQLSGAPDAEALYQILGGIYEKLGRNKEAILIYEEFLRVFPESNDASAVKSFIVQIRKSEKVRE